MKRLVYLIGAPGSGKSSLMAGLTRRCWRRPLDEDGVARDQLLIDGRLIGVEVGRLREAFSGTDALGMAVHPKAVLWISALARDALVLAEGQRLATLKFLHAATTGDYLVDLVWLDTPPDVCAARRAARGSKQTDSWVKGATTRVGRLAAQAEHLAGVEVTRVESASNACDLADDLADHLGLMEELAL